MPVPKEGTLGECDPLSRPQQEDWALLESLAAAGVYMVRNGQDTSTLPHQVFWALDELDGKDHAKMIVDLGCMRTVAGTTWVNRVAQKWIRLKRYLKVVPEGEKCRFGDGQVVDSDFGDRRRWDTGIVEDFSGSW